MTLPRGSATLVLSGMMVLIFIVEVMEIPSSPDPDAMFSDLGAIVPGMLSRMELWRLLAAIFLHAGLLHLLFNLWAFLQLGYAIELLFGAKRFLIVFFGSGILAGVASALFVRPPGAVGASGAIFGLISSLMVLIFRAPQWRTALWTRRLAWQLAVWGGVALVLGFFAPRIDNAAHIGGVIAGAVIGWQLSPR